ncbi:copia protein-like protein [Leptotrombidium deliense]|uniref:Copia protein-like protein n=1 Tax=Leptotrombidium deliense TaxID=299467 RepID=A0A443RS47_9ACAR|nr:copia protein-like protein [Leptotrombidium deliense]
MLNGGTVSWLSQKQKCVSLSTTESEYIAAATTTKEMIWLRELLKELLHKSIDALAIYCDNLSAIKLVKNPEFHKRTKHIDVRYHFIREKQEEGIINILHVPSENQLADLLTKPLVPIKFHRLRSLIGVN